MEHSTVMDLCLGPPQHLKWRALSKSFMLFDEYFHVVFLVTVIN